MPERSKQNDKASLEDISREVDFLTYEVADLKSKLSTLSIVQVIVFILVLLIFIGSVYETYA